MIKFKSISLALFIVLFTTQASMATSQPAQTESWGKKATRIVLCASLLLSSLPTIAFADTNNMILDTNRRTVLMSNTKIEYNENLERINFLVSVLPCRLYRFDLFYSVDVDVFLGIMDHMELNEGARILCLETHLELKKRLKRQQYLISLWSELGGTW